MDNAQRLMVLRHFANGSTPAHIGHSLGLPSKDVAAALNMVGYCRDRARTEARHLRCMTVTGRMQTPPQPSAFSRSGPKALRSRLRRGEEADVA